MAKIELEKKVVYIIYNILKTNANINSYNLSSSLLDVFD